MVPTNRKESSRFPVPRSLQRQPGCSTLPLPSSSQPARSRNKVALKPGHSALDWHEKSQSQGVKGRLIHGIDPGAAWWENFISLQHPASIRQLEIGIPVYRIRPPLRVDKVTLEWNKDNNWCVIKGRVYCLTDYLDFHPGGVDILLKNCQGKDATALFDRYHRWVNVERLLEFCAIGEYIL
ncbi:HGL067Wp [Eremothecium sinecaudum]|uniref:HGL067Wp n=1 Tax=Eremothecium sinecaudum TaxID=45286 RepID=A0A109V005_9SACH|nr:HGL067Wp [Eremothecium sinecaudum]AMD22273.1 HGL067Wp [Eremothecium sinecaudum]